MFRAFGEQEGMHLAWETFRRHVNTALTALGATKLVGQKHTHNVCDTCKHCVECIDALELLSKKLAFDVEAAKRKQAGSSSRRKPCSGFSFENDEILAALKREVDKELKEAREKTLMQHLKAVIEIRKSIRKMTELAKQCRLQCAPGTEGPVPFNSVAGAQVLHVDDMPTRSTECVACRATFSRL